MICQACNESRSQHLYATKVCKLNLRAAATYHNKQCLQDDADIQSALVCRLLAYVEGFLCVHSPPSEDQLLGFGPANQPRQQLCASSPAVQLSLSGLEACHSEAYMATWISVPAHCRDANKKGDGIVGRSRTLV